MRNNVCIKCSFYVPLPLLINMSMWVCTTSHFPINSRYHALPDEYLVSIIQGFPFEIEQMS